MTTDLKNYELHLSCDQIAYRTPMKFGGRVVEDVAVLTVTSEVELVGGQRGRGIGSMTMGVAWAWPSRVHSSDQTLAAVRLLAERLVTDAVADPIGGHPLEVCARLAERRGPLVDGVVNDLDLQEAIPELAVLMAASPLEAALFDAHGKALDTSSFALLGKDVLPYDLGRYLGPDFAGLRLDAFVRATPQPEMPLYHLVGALDPLTPDDVAVPVGDGLPEDLEAWIAADGLTHLKIKLAGDDLDWDVARVLGVNAVAEAAAARQWAYSLDFNERCENAQYVLELLDQLQAKSPAGLARVQYIEQPTHRDLAAHPENRMDRVAERLPVVIDESLVGLESLLLARELGYSGVALKACKGHAEALLMGAAAQHLGLFLCVQDLTCVGVSLLHSASLAAHIPTVAAIESNGRQYCPVGNDALRAAYPGMFDVSAGRVPTRLLDGPGLGYVVAAGT